MKCNHYTWKDFTLLIRIPKPSIIIRPENRTQTLLGIMTTTNYTNKEVVGFYVVYNVGNKLMPRF